MKKLMITLAVAFATTISAFAQSIDTLRVDSVSFIGLNSMTGARVHFAYENLSDTGYVYVNFGVTPNFNNNSLNPMMVPAGTDTFSVVLTGLTANTGYSVKAYIAWPLPMPFHSNVFTFTTASCNFQAAITVATGNYILCPGQSVALTASPMGTSRVWYRDGIAMNETFPGILYVNQSGNYTVAITNGCTTTSAITTITESNPVATVTPNGPTTFCVGGSVDLTANAGSGYLWNNGSTAQTVTASAGNYYVTVTDANGCSATSDTTSVSSITSGATITAGGPLDFCQGGSVTLYSSSQTGNTWSTGAQTPSITVNQSDTVYVQVDNGGCTGQSPNVIVTMNSLPTTPVITASGNLEFCEGGSVQLTSPIASSYLWSSGATTMSIPVTTGGSYAVRVTDANGCQSLQSSVVTVMVNPMPTPEISYVGSTTFCEGGSVQLSAFGAGTYEWNTGQTTQTVTASASGNYTVTVTNQFGCVASASQSVTVNSLPSPTVTANGSTTLCEGESVTLTTSTPGSYTWSTGHTDQSISVSNDGTYTVTVVDANGCEGTSDPLPVTVNPSPEVGIVQMGPNGSSITANVFGGMAPFNYLWSTGSTTPSITVFQNGQYGVTVTDANGCEGSNLTSVVGVGIEEVLDQIGTEIAYVRVVDLGGREIATLRSKYELMQLPFGVYVVTCHDKSGEVIYSAKMTR